MAAYSYFYKVPVRLFIISLLLCLFPGRIFPQVADQNQLIQEQEQQSLTKEDSIVFNQFLYYINQNRSIDALPINPYFLPPVFDGKFGFNYSLELPKNPYQEQMLFFRLPEDTLVFPSTTLGKTPFREKAFRDYLRNHMRSIRYSYADFGKAEPIEEIKPNIFENLFSVEPEIEFEKNEIDDGTQYIPKIRYWKYSGSSLLQVSQNDISENWSSGGTSNFNLLSIQNFTANYKKDGIQFNNFIEWKLSFNKNDKDEQFKIGEDLFRTYSDFGIRAFNDKWSYSSNLEIKTQLFAHSQGDPKIYVSNFFSPTQINMGILGMKYQLEKKSDKDRYRKTNFSIDVSPFSVQSRWIFNDKIDPGRHGIEKGKKYIINTGSTVNAKVTITFNRAVSFSSRFKFFTDYKKAVAESENELKLAFSQYFSTRIYLFVIYDDSKNKHKDLGHFQYNQLLSFGFNYKW